MHKNKNTKTKKRGGFIPPLRSKTAKSTLSKTKLDRKKTLKRNK